MPQLKATARTWAWAGPCYIHALVCAYLCVVCVCCEFQAVWTHLMWCYDAQNCLKKWSSACQNLEAWKNFFSPLQTFNCSVCLTSLWLSSRSTHPWSAIGTLQLVVWTSLQWAICLNTRWNWCPHLPEAINLKYDSLCSWAAILLLAECNKAELRWIWRGGRKPAHGP